MKALVLSKFTHIWLPLIALILFVSVFATMLLLVYRRRSKELYAEARMLPLEEGQIDER